MVLSSLALIEAEWELKTLQRIVDNGRFRVEAHQRLTSPLLGLALPLIGLAALLTGEFNRRGQGRRILAAVGLAVAVQAGTLGAANIAARDLAAVPLLYAITLLPTPAALWFLVGRRPWVPRPILSGGRVRP
mgnify:CR=1 FL=1